ncbi:MAG TPA: ABC transporter ATP-binding protein [Cyanobacteria bacterium UBA9971]|nr:ABC transporter ATP-binding protein [Cyanobacteria bacterium UBA9971]
MLIKVKNISKSFDDNVILNNINFSVDAGEILAIVGFSGSGKSTVLKIISGLEEIDSGEVVLGDKEIGMAFQYSALFDSMSVYENVAFALKERAKFKKLYTEDQIKQIVREKLETVGLSGIEDKFPSELSGGMQKRVGFARAIVTNPRIILYDEPTAGLDPVSSTVIEEYIVKLKNDLNAASVIVTHQLSTITKTADRVIMLYEGKIVWEGTPVELLTSVDPYAYQFVNAQKDGPMIAVAH